MLTFSKEAIASKKNLLLCLLLLFKVFFLEATGLTYKVLPGGCFTSIYILVVDPRGYSILPVKASKEQHGRETVLALAQHYDAIAAINGGFWKADGTPAGILKIDHFFYGTSSKLRGAIGWSLGGNEVSIDRVYTKRSDSKIEVLTGSQSFLNSYENWNHFEHIVGGAPVLIKDGKMVEDYAPEKILASFLNKSHARTAVGIKKTGEWVFVVVDGRFFLLGGMKIKELAELMLKLGCVEALNLDGGGSSTMVLNGRTVNAPCGKRRESNKRIESVSDAILILPSKSPLH